MAENPEELSSEFNSKERLKEGNLSKDDLRKRFHELARRWRRSTMFESDLRKILRSEHYREIAKLGREVVPIIIEEFSRRPDHWHAVLVYLTKANPAKEESAGDSQMLARDWKEWFELNSSLFG